jgi:F0F1-type ATP synthase gamma subunit
MVQRNQKSTTVVVTNGGLAGAFNTNAIKKEAKNRHAIILENKLSLLLVKEMIFKIEDSV